jgi:hypothetical protein
MKFIVIMYDKIINGAIFCQLIKIRLVYQFNPSITLGNQKWKGAVPLFNIIVDNINIGVYSIK